MPLELRFAIAATVAMTLGIVSASAFARQAAPAYALMGQLLARGHPWQIADVTVASGKSRLDSELQLHGLVFRQPHDVEPVARVIGRVQVGEVIETPLVFWTLVLAWPTGTLREKACRCAVAVPIYVALELMTTAMQLMMPMSEASAILEGDPDPVTWWGRWSYFLEAGGQFVVAAVLAIVAVALTARALHRGTRTAAQGAAL